MLSGSSPEREQRRMVVSNIQCLVSRTGLPACDSVLDVLRLAECSLHDCLELIDLSRVLSREPAEAKSKMDKVRRLEERLHAAEDDSDALRMACMRVDELTAERSLLNAGTEHTNAERGPLAPLFANCRLLQRCTMDS